MSYLHLPRLIFSGDFKSDVSTVNNVTQYFNNPTFQSGFQKEPLGLWNPEGGASFAFMNCEVEQIMLPDGAQQANDCIIGCSISAPQDKSPGKMVDLDPQQQMVSQLWAMTLRIADAQDELLFQGDIKPVGFRDLQSRQTDAAPNGQALGATWTSVLTNVIWGDKASSSPFLTKLKSVTQGNKLTLNLNSFGYYYEHLDGRFSLGRTLGSIGPWFEGEPNLFAPARRLYGVFVDSQGSVDFQFSNFLFEKENKRLTIDFGGSIQIADAIGTISDSPIPDGGQTLQSPQQFLVAVINKPIDNGADTTPQIFTKDDFVQIGELNYQAGTDWLNTTGGIIVFDNLPDEVSKQLVNNQLVLLSPSAGNSEQFVLIAREAVNGYVVRADDFVQRLDYNQTNGVNLYAYQWGEPLADQAFAITLEPPTKPRQNRIKIIPGIGSPQDGLKFTTPTSPTDKDGRTRLDITGNAIHSPRGYVDGQIYKMDYQLQNIPTDPLLVNYPLENISIHLRDYFEVPENPTWNDISEIMTQYGNLYPIMSKYIVDLKNPTAVKAKKDILIFAFTRDITDPIHMPVTRDLSEAKREAIVKWLEAPDLELGEKSENFDKSEEKSADFDKSLESGLTAEPETELTEKQIRFEKLQRSKSGIDFLIQKTESSEDK
jgi:hypothetical protein